MGRIQAALLGAREVGFTVLTISVSLVAVFIPLLFMGGIVGRLSAGCAVTLSAAVLMSLVVSLTTTAMMCAVILRPHRADKPPGGIARAARAALARMLAGYGRLLDWALDPGPATVVMLLGIVALNVSVFAVIQKGFFPQQDTGQLMGGIRAAPSAWFQAMQDKLHEFVGIIGADAAVHNVVAFTGGQRAGGGVSQVR